MYEKLNKNENYDLQKGVSVFPETYIYTDKTPQNSKIHKFYLNICFGKGSVRAKLLSKEIANCQYFTCEKAL